MRTLTRYVSFEFLAVFSITLAGITAFMLVVGVGREAVREGLSFGPLLRIMPFIVPVSMRFSIPAAALLAACSVFGRMSGENEVVAIKSLGISPQAVISPVLVLAFLISVFAVWINDVAVSWGRPGVSRVLTESIEQIAYGWLRTQRYFKRDNFSIHVRRVEGDRLIQPIVTFFGEDEESTTVVAREAILRRDPESSRLVISLKDAVAEGSTYEGAFPGQNEWELDLEKHLSGGKALSPSDLALHQLTVEREVSRQRVNQLKKSLAVDAAHSLLMGDFASLNSESSSAMFKELTATRYRQNRLRTEPWRRWANGFSCFFFVYVGAPLSIRRRHSDFVTSFFLTFLPILLVYYPLMAYGVDRAKAGELPQYSVWLGNLACAGWGFWLMRRVTRY